MASRRQLLATASWAAAALAAGCRRSERRAFAPAEGASSDVRAVNAAKRFAGTTLNVGWETGPQSQDLLQWSGPLWERLTGIHVNVVELGSPIDAFRRMVAEHRAGAGGLDLGMVAPGWMPDLLLEDALEQLDGYIDHFGLPADVQDMLPLYRTLGAWNGRRFGLFDDGDVLLLYYRRDLFEDPANQRDFAAQFGRPLGTPRGYDWQQFMDAARFFSERGGQRLYGLAPFNRDLRWGWFQARLRRNGGRFFDPATMKPGVDEEPGTRTMSELAQVDHYTPPGVGDIAPKDAMLTTYASGACAMASFWPPLGRWTEGYGIDAPAYGGFPRTRVTGKTGYALLPGDVTELALGFFLCVFSRSRQKEPAYLFAQWLNSPAISLERVMLPYALRDPFRLTHVSSPRYRKQWASAPAYLDLLAAAATRGALLDLIIPGHADYADAFFVAITEVRLGTDVPTAMRRMAQTWEAITERYGRGRQRAAYAEYLQRPGATFPGAAAETGAR
jgi:multiple sugar transport system substrate-binding protein